MASVNINAKKLKSADKGLDSLQKITTAMDEVQVTTKDLNDNVEQTAPSLDSDLKCLIDESTKKGSGVNLKMLEKTAHAVKAYLRQEDNDAKLLLKYKGFTQFFIKLLQQTANNGNSLQFTSAWIFDAILSRCGADSSYDKSVGKFVVAENIVVPLFAKLLQSPDKTIYEKAIGVIHKLLSLKSGKAQLLSNATSVVSPLAKILRGKSPSKQLIESTTIIVTELVLNKSPDLKKQKTDYVFTQNGPIGFPDDVTIGNKYKPSARLLKLALPAIAAVMELDTAQSGITCYMLECVYVALQILKDAVPIVDSGCCPKIASCFSSDRSMVIYAALIVTERIAACGPSAVLKFLKTLKETDGLLNYWKCFTLDSSLPISSAVFETVEKFLQVVADVVHRDLNGEGINMAINSGIIDSLIKCVNHSDHTMDKYHHSALCILQCMLSQLPVHRRDVAASILPSALDHLRAHRCCPVATKCIRIVVTLAEGNCERRDKAIMHGAITCLVDVLPFFYSSHPEVLAQGHEVLKCILFLLQGNPKPELQFFCNVPEALKNYMRAMRSTSIECMETALAILADIAAHGFDGMCLLLQVGILPHIMSFLELKNCFKIQAHAMRSFFSICRYGSSGHVKELLRCDLVQNLENVLGSPSDDVRTIGLKCLLAILKDINKLNLPPRQREEIKKLMPFIKKEKNGNTLGTQALARVIFELMSKLK